MYVVMSEELAIDHVHLSRHEGALQVWLGTRGVTMIALNLAEVPILIAALDEMMEASEFAKPDQQGVIARAKLPKATATEAAG